MSTFGELKENVSLELGLDQTADNDDDVLLGRRLNEAVREVLNRLQLYVISGTISLTADDNEYELNTALSTDPLEINEIVNSDSDPLERVSVQRILELRRGSEPSGSNVMKYAVDGANLLLVYPTPAGASDLTVYYVPKPTEMDTSDDDPSTTTFGGIPVQYHTLLEYWASFRMAMRDDDASSQMGQAYKQLFEEGLVRARRSRARMGGRRLSRVQIGRRQRVPRDPSQDI